MMKSRFARELSGQFGEFWTKHAHEEMQRAKLMFRDEAYVVNGVCRWKSNNRCIMDDMAEKMEMAGCEFDRKATEAKRDVEDAEFFAEYRRQQANHKPSAEELFELEAAFGNAHVVDVITGQRIK
jgi:hypothetical protein